MEPIKTIDANIALMQDLFETHKCTSIAWKQFGIKMSGTGYIDVIDADKFWNRPEGVLVVARLHSYNGNAAEPSNELAHLMRKMVAHGRLSEINDDHLYAELYWCLTDSFPGNFFSPLLADPRMEPIADLAWCPQRLDHHPEGDVYTHTLLAISYANRRWNDRMINFSLLCHDFGKPDAWEASGKAHAHEELGLPIVDKFSRAVRAPKRLREMAHLTCKLHTKVHGIMGRNGSKGARPGHIVDLISETKGLNKDTYSFECFLKVCEADAKGRGANSKEVLDFNNKPYPQASFLRACAFFLRELDVTDIKARHKAKYDDPVRVKRHVREYRADKLKCFIESELTDLPAILNYVDKMKHKAYLAKQAEK